MNYIYPAARGDEDEVDASLMAMARPEDAMAAGPRVHVLVPETPVTCIRSHRCAFCFMPDKGAVASQELELPLGEL